MKKQWLIFNWTTFGCAVLGTIYSPVNALPLFGGWFVGMIVSGIVFRASA